MSEIFLILRVYLWVMSIEAIVYSLYISRCLRNNYTNHKLYTFSVICLAILYAEIIRAVLVLWGMVPYIPKHIAVLEIELAPFGFVTYEIFRRYYHRIAYSLEKIWT